MKLDFIGIGAPRCGTTWLNTCLKEHPEICMCKIKDINFFRDAKKTEWSNLEKYSSYFECKERQKKGEFSAGYFSDEKSPRRIKQLFPNTRIIISMRNPVNWAISAFLNTNKHEKINNKNIDKEIKKRFNKKHLYYSNNLKKWFKLFNKKQIHLIRFENIKKGPEGVVEDLYNFLEVDKNFKPEILNKKKNSSHTFYLPHLQKIAKKIYNKTKQNQKLYNLTKKTKLKQLGEYLTKVNKRETNISIKPDTKKYLYDQFKKDIKELEKITNIKFTKYWKYEPKK